MGPDPSSGTDSESLEHRVARLEAFEAIRQLKARYCDICDAGHDPDLITTIFLEDGVWESATHGAHRGHEAIRQQFRRFGNAISASQHMVTNPVIELDKDLGSAHANWNFLAPMVFDSQARWSFVRYEDDYVRVGGEWKVKHMRVTLRLTGEQAGGWKESSPWP